MKNKELKPCPFCGGIAEIICYEGDWQVYCRDCYVETEEYCDYIKGGQTVSGKERAIQAWNRRAYEATD